MRFTMVATRSSRNVRHFIVALSQPSNFILLVIIVIALLRLNTGFYHPTFYNSAFPRSPNLPLQTALQPLLEQAKLHDSLRPPEQDEQDPSVLRVEQSNLEQEKLRQPKPAKSKRPYPVCADPFHVTIQNSTNTPHVAGRPWPCFVRAPRDYRPPFPGPHALWKVPRPNLGKLDRTNSEYKLHVNRQRWAYMGDKVVSIREAGGTSGRAFEDNFEYVKVLLNTTVLSPRCGKLAPPVMLDMGGGIGSVPAAFADPRGGGGAVRTLSYVWPDDYMRLQAIMSHRLVPSYLSNFTGSVPFPDESLDFVHCKWCWHHVVGYDLWLNEVNRVLVPGGYFIFTFTKANDNILRHPEWEKSLARQPLVCKREKKIVLICRKKFELPLQAAASIIATLEHDYCPQNVRRAINKPRRKLEQRWVKVLQETGQALDSLVEVLSEDTALQRVLNINCPEVALCAELETWMSNTTFVHIGSREDSEVTAGLLGERKIAMLHDWEWNMPVYPRSFDLVNVGCSVKTAGLLSTREFWMDVHRVLRPGGAVVLMRSFCEWKVQTMRHVLTESSFYAKRLSNDVLTARRLDV